MNEFEKEALLISIERQTTDEGKISMARRFLTDSALHVQELCEVLALLHYDTSRQELTQLAADKLIDPENLPVVYNTFRIKQDRPPQPNLEKWHRKQPLQ